MCLKPRIMDEKINTRKHIMTDEVKEECLKRLKILRLSKDVISEFKNNNKVYVSEPRKKPRELSTEELIQLLQIEQKEKVSVYHVLRSDDDTFYLCVNENIKDWKDEKIDLRLGYAVARHFNIENRTLGIETADGIVEKILI